MMRFADDAAATSRPPSQSWLDPRVELRTSQIEGRGLFATQPIREGETVSVLGGRVLGDAEVDALIKAGERYDGIALAPDRNLAIEPATWPGRHGNHSCDPNLWMEGSYRIVAARDVTAGEELTIDYALHSIRAGWEMTCRCASSTCRKTIRGDDWRLSNLQHRYRGHWPPALAQLIAAAEDQAHG